MFYILCDELFTILQGHKLDSFFNILIFIATLQFSVIITSVLEVRKV